MAIRAPLDSRATGLMILLCLIWGLQQVAIKAASADVAPVLQIALRSGAAALIVGVLLLVRRRTLRRVEGAWQPGIAVGLLFALEYLAVSEGLRLTSAAHMVIFLYTAPIFVAIGLHFRFPGERLKGVQWLGIAIAFCGVAVAFYSPETPGSDARHQRLGDALALLAALLWAATTLTIRCTRLAETPAPLTLFYQLAGAFVLLMAAALASGQMHLHLTGIVVASLVFQTLVVSVFSFLTWFWLLGRYLGSRLGVLAFLTPLFGVGLGAWLLGEHLESVFVVGSLMVLVGIFLVSGHDLLITALRRRALAS
ncbi:DMT family transporter [Pseudomonas sp. dw_358]|uniref:DMT family transporter n=1 Tax=Pseudomonas sp. dw_358 TaxID=2720083 RepID=UPI001BD44FBA|nr:DMT family transporter [Pseudomonas sp. dw_358]